MKTRIFAASAALLALLSVTVLATAGQEGKKGKTDDDRTTHLRRASEIVGLDVRDPDGDDAGEIHDIVVDPKSGKVLYFAVETGGTFGVGSRYHAVAPQALRLTTGTTTGQTIFAIGVDAAKFQNEQGFNTNDWPRRPTWGPGARKDGDKEGDTGGKSEGDAIARTSRINGTDVRNKNKEDLGDIYDLMIDTRNWQIHYAAITHGATGGVVGGKLYPVAWKALHLRSEDGAQGRRFFELDATKADFDRARGFVSTDAWPENPDPILSGGGREKGDREDDGDRKDKERD